MNFARYFVHKVTVEKFLGASSDGDAFASGVTKTCFRDDKIRLVRNATGEQVVSQTTLYGPLADLATYRPDSRVSIVVAGAPVANPGSATYPGADLFPGATGVDTGRSTRVIAVFARDSAGRFPDHVEVHLE